MVVLLPTFYLLPGHCLHHWRHSIAFWGLMSQYMKPFGDGREAICRYVPLLVQESNAIISFSSHLMEEEWPLLTQ